MAHRPGTKTRIGTSCCLLGHLVADAGQGELKSTLDDCESASMQSPFNVATSKRHTNVLQHLAGSSKRAFASDEESELHGAIADDVRSRVPLVAPMALLKHDVRQSGRPRANAQLCLEPYPRTLRLRNQI